MRQNSKIIIENSDEAPESNVADMLFSLKDKEKLKASIIVAHEKFREAVSTGKKDFIRELHVNSKNYVSTDIYPEIWRLYKKHANKFIGGRELNPAKIQPSLKLVEAGTIWEELFKVTRHTWSIPYTKGYGRRIRFVVYDEYHEAVIGILGFQSPPADLACRDVLFKYPKEKKMELINRTMDVYTIGAIPPYSNILGGKLVAGLVCSEDVRRAYWKLYAGKRTIMEDSSIEQPLVAVTTTSVFGRSSIYNRLKYKNRLLAEPIGYTKGFGTIHLEQLYQDVKRLLISELGDCTTGGYGNGPKIRWQNFARALSILGLPSTYFEHGMQREVFLFRFVDDLGKGMSGGEFGAPFILSVSEYAEHWKERWAIPRSVRIESWKEFDSSQYFSELLQVSRRQ
jgi:hypothetical protein